MVSICGAIHVISKPFSSFTRKVLSVFAEPLVDAADGLDLKSRVCVVGSEVIVARAGVRAGVDEYANSGAKVKKTTSARTAANFFIITFHFLVSEFWC